MTVFCSLNFDIYIHICTFYLKASSFWFVSFVRSFDCAFLIKHTISFTLLLTTPLHSTTPHSCFLPSPHVPLQRNVWNNIYKKKKNIFQTTLLCRKYILYYLRYVIVTLTLCYVMYWLVLCSKSLRATAACLNLIDCCSFI